MSNILRMLSKKPPIKPKILKINRNGTITKTAARMPASINAIYGIISTILCQVPEFSSSAKPSWQLSA